MGTRRILTFLLLCLMLPAVAGCGSGSSSGGSFGEAAKAFPSGSLAYVDVNIDPNSAAWENLQSLGSRFQTWDSIVAELQHSLYSGKDGETFKRIEGSLGGEAAAAVTNLGDGTGNPTAVVYVESTDDSKLLDEVKRDNSTTALDAYKGYDVFKSTDSSDSFGAIGDGALLVSNTLAGLKSAIDTRQGDAESLADDAAFQDAEKDFSKDALANAWVDTRKLAGIASLGALGTMSSDPQAASGLSQLTEGLKGVDSLTASVEARDNGFAFAATLHGPRAGDVGFEPSLLDRVPGSAFAFLTANDIGPAIEKALAAQAQSDPAVKQFERQTGISIKDDLVPLLTGEHLFYVGPGLPIGGALILHPPDLQQGAATMRKLTAFAVKQSAGQMQVSDLPDGNGQQLLIGPGLSLIWHVQGDAIVISTDEQAGGPADEPIVDSQKFRALLGESGAPDDAKALFYLDTQGLLGLIPTAQSMGPDARALGGMLAWQERGSDVYRTGFFLEIRAGSGNASG